MNITLLACMSKNRIIGRNNELPWHCPEDLKFFKVLTLGHNIIMGRNTFESLPKILSCRKHIIVSPSWWAQGKEFRDQDIVVVNTLEDALAIPSVHDDNVVFIIGGGQLFSKAINVATSIILTVLPLQAIGDTYFPVINKSKWKLVDSFTKEVSLDYRRMTATVEIYKLK